MDDILSASDVALICDVEERTARRWLATGLLKGKQLNKWTWATTRADVDAALASGTIRKSPGRGRRPIAMLGGQSIEGWGGIIMAWRSNMGPEPTLTELMRRQADLERRIAALERVRALPGGHGWHTSRLEPLADLAHSSFARDAAVGALGGETHAERRTPARAADFMSDVLVPFCWAAGTSLVAAGTCAILSDSLGGDWWVWFKIGGALGFAGMWAYRIFDHSRLLWAVESFTHTDLNGDANIGQPPAPEHIEATITDRRKGHSTIWKVRYPGKPHLLRRFAAYYTDGGSFSERDALKVGYSQFEALRDLFLLNGWAHWRNPDAHTQGVELDEVGIQVLEQMTDTPIEE